MQSFSDYNFHPRISVVLCSCCLKEPSFDRNAFSRGFPGSIFTFTGLCIGKSKSSDVAHAFEEGADGVILCGCQVGHCENSNNLDRLRLIHHNQKLMKDIGLAPARLTQEYLPPGCCTNKMQTAVENFISRIKRLGPVRQATVLENKAEA